MTTVIDVERCYLHGVKAIISGVEKQYQPQKPKTQRTRRAHVSSRSV
jgi:hypothetical protein